MKRIINLLFVITLITNVLKPSQLIAQKNLDNVIDCAVEKLQKDKNNEAAIQKIQSAYPEATIIDNLEIQKLISQKDNWPTIYNIYKQMDLRQEKVFSVLPLYLDEKEITFKKVDYKSKMLLAKENAGNFHYNLAKEFARKGEKKDFQMAYYQINLAIEYLGKEDSLIKLEKYYQEKGIYNVLIKCNNQIPEISQEMINEIEKKLSQNTNGLWIKYFTINNKPSKLDFTLEINLKKFGVDQAQKKCWERKFWSLDDSNCEYYHTTQFKNSKLIYNLNYKYYNSDKNYYQPKGKRYIYEYTNEYATYIGNIKSIPKELLDYIYKDPIEMPNKKQMLEYTIEEFNNLLCQKLLSIEGNILLLQI